uniref:Rhodanese domain-containing protein n=1 Tax=Compsopogon caeruleus TaxID=31354 RepID=A0A7S1XEX9_9RHOD|mmetsp:Transcript_18419/g.38557  ORF Transcript_18419/g.38557 Transcript_18419/m.38557 type:complete len:1032 (+) Transcript_18419:27-3122(+)
MVRWRKSGWLQRKDVLGMRRGEEEDERTRSKGQGKENDSELGGVVAKVKSSTLNLPALDESKEPLGGLRKRDERARRGEENEFGVRALRRTNSGDREPRSTMTPSPTRTQSYTTRAPRRELPPIPESVSLELETSLDEGMMIEAEEGTASSILDGSLLGVSSLRSELPEGAASQEVLSNMVRANVLGVSRVAATPFGGRKKTCADFISTGRSLAFIEDFMKDEVLSIYQRCTRGSQIEQYYQDAQNIIHSYVGGLQSDLLFFHGTGTLGAAQCLIAILGIGKSPFFDHVSGIADGLPIDLRPVIFTGQFEYIATDRLWEETQATVVKIREDERGYLDIDHLEQQLIFYSKNPIRIGSFSISHNISGAVVDTVKISQLLHKHNALSCWDYGSAGQHVPIEMNPRNSSGELLDGAHKDAIFISPHRFIGGPGCPGLLIVKADIGSTVKKGSSSTRRGPPANHTPPTPGDVYHGAPPVLGVIRCGLVFQLMQQMNYHYILGKESDYVNCAISKWARNENIRILGGDSSTVRVGSIALTIRGLHSGFVVLLLEELFGLQVHGGFSFRPITASRLLDISSADASNITTLLRDGFFVARPGWIRVDFLFFFSQTVVNYIIQCIDFVASNGWKFLAVYDLDIRTGQWSHVTRNFEELKGHSLLGINYSHGFMEFSHPQMTDSENALDTYLREAKVIVAEIEKQVLIRHETMDPQPIYFPDQWVSSAKFLLRQDCLRAIRRGTTSMEVARTLAATRSSARDKMPAGKTADSLLMGHLKKDSIYRIKPGLRSLPNMTETFASGKTTGLLDNGLRDEQGLPFLGSIDVPLIINWDAWISSALKPQVHRPDDARVLRRIGFTESSDSKVYVSSDPSNARLQKIYEVYGAAKKDHFPTVEDIEVSDLVSFKKCKLVLLDVRTLEEREISKISGSISVDMSLHDLPEIWRPKSKDSLVFIACISTFGVRSGLYCKVVLDVLRQRTKALGVGKLKVNVRNVKGGLLAWLLAGQQLQNSRGSSTLSLHPFRRELERSIPHLFTDSY